MSESISNEKWEFGINPNKWFTVDEICLMFRRGPDAIRRRINAGKLQAFVLPTLSTKRKRVYNSESVQGAELIRVIKANLTARK